MTVDVARVLLDGLDEDGLAELARRLGPHLAAVRPVDTGLTVDAAAAVAGVSAKTIRRALKAGTLHGEVVAARWRIRPQDLERWTRAGAPTSLEHAAVGAGRPARRAGSTGATAILNGSGAS